MQVKFFQSNAEHLIIDEIHRTFSGTVDAIIVNPGAFTHTSIAIRDAFLSVKSKSRGHTNHGVRSCIVLP